MLKEEKERINLNPIRPMEDKDISATIDELTGNNRIAIDHSQRTGDYTILGNPSSSNALVNDSSFINPRSNSQIGGRSMIAVNPLVIEENNTAIKGKIEQSIAKKLI